jgi:NtrC-family two-component system sensor histidine kinase KinB
MKTSIRSKRFTMGMVLFLVSILLLSVSSAFYLNRLSGKTSAILKENHYSVVYAQDMSKVLITINRGIINSFLTNRSPDTAIINREFMLFDKSLRLEKNNLTEVGEDHLVSDIETNYSSFHDSVAEFIRSPDQVIKVLNLQEKSDTLYQKLMLLAQMNEKAIEGKTYDAKVSAKKATTQMTFIGTLCFLIAYGFTFIFSSYFNERFYRLYNGIKEIVSSNYSNRLYLDGNDELTEISVAFNEMAEKLNTNKQKMSVTLREDLGKDKSSDDIDDLKKMLFQIKTMEEKAEAMLSRLEKK